MKKILYLDASALSGVYHTSPMSTADEPYAVASFNALREKFGKNALVYLPANATATFDNFAYAKKGEVVGFQAANNVVLTDKNPFYSPYDIQMDAANKVEYKRQVTTDKYGKVQNASLILPFVIALDGGKHTNPDGTWFTLHTLQTSNAISKDGNSTYAYMPAVDDVTTSVANTPYLVKLDENSTEGGVSFIVAQPGSTIYATTSMNKTDYTFAGSSSTGTVDNATVTFTPTGTYAGQQVEKTKNIFYFANNEFVNSADYRYNALIKVSPFRAYFASSGMPANNVIHTLSVVFGENLGGESDGIEALSANVNVDMNAPVYDLQGRKLADSIVGATLKKGIYVIDGVKFTVK